MTKYNVVDWNTGEVLLATDLLPCARRVARNCGHDGTHNGKYYAPIAFVSQAGFCVYNPRFVVGKDDEFKSIPLVNQVQPGPRKCSHGLTSGCSYGCN